MTAKVIRRCLLILPKVGLLPAGNEQQVPFAYKMYRQDTELGWKQSVLFVS